MSYASYIVYRVFVSIIGWLPWRMTYWISDLLAFFLMNIMKYRREVVESQVSRCFPHLSKDQQAKLVKASYANLADIFIESFKSPSFTPKTLSKRYKVRNPEVVNELAKTHKGLIATGAHFNNWEWGTLALPLFLDTTIYGIYKPLKNKYINRFVNSVRDSYGTKLMPLTETRKLFQSPPTEPSLFVFVADQSPTNMREAIWLDFLGQDTACLHGPEKYHEFTGYPVIHIHIYRVKRGYYELELSRVDGKNEAGVTHEFMRLVEQDILESPGSWLWTHKRWKRRREEADEQLEKLRKRRLEKVMREQ